MCVCLTFFDGSQGKEWILCVWVSHNPLQYFAYLFHDVSSRMLAQTPAFSIRRSVSCSSWPGWIICVKRSLAAVIGVNHISCTLLYDATRPWYNQAGGVNEFFCNIPAYEGVSDMEVLFKCVFIFTLGCQRINPFSVFYRCHSVFGEPPDGFVNRPVIVDLFSFFISIAIKNLQVYILMELVKI